MTAHIESSGQNEWTTFVATLANNLNRYRLLPVTPPSVTMPPITPHPTGEETGPQPLVLGVSGGADSIGLLHAMADLAETLNLRIHVAHVDHGLRPESGDEARFVGILSDKLGCRFHRTTLDPDLLQNQPGGVEAAARNARYAFLCQVASNVTASSQVPIVATAHHADDQAETLLLHLVRGSGLRGLGGMRWKIEVTSAYFGVQSEKPGASARPVWLIRPMLNLRREVIRAYLQRHQLAWCEDASNADTAYTRNYLRSEVMPRLSEVNPQVVDALCRTAEIIAGDAARLETLDRRNLATLLVEPAHEPTDYDQIDRVVLDLHGLMALSRADQRGVLRVAVAILAGLSDDFDFAASERLLDQLPSPPANSGPHPIVGEYAWSVLVSVLVSVLADEPDQCPLLSIHQAETLPISSHGAPQLDAGHAPIRLPLMGEIVINGWQLVFEELAMTEIPSTWRRVSPWEAWFDADQVGTPTLATQLPGMVIAPLGLEGRTKSVGDLFTDAKVHPTLRPVWPIIVDEERGTVLWVCGQRLAHRARITGDTTRVLHLAWTRMTP